MAWNDADVRTTSSLPMAATGLCSSATLPGFPVSKLPCESEKTVRRRERSAGKPDLSLFDSLIYHRLSTPGFFQFIFVQMRSRFESKNFVPLKNAHCFEGLEI